MSLKNPEERHAWITKAKSLLEPEQVKLVENIQVGSWVIHTGETIFP
jgi:hypothetical protein